MCLALLGTSACSTAAQSNGRRGLFGDLLSRDRRYRGGDSSSGMSDRGPAASAREGDSSARSSEPPVAAVAAARRLRLRWPLRHVLVTSRFGKRPRDFHEGIDLQAKSGTPVYAAQEGKVIYAGSQIRGYGKMIVIKHAYGISTVYAHNSRLFVKKGQHVRLGQKIAASGNTGRSTGPHVHFEVRHGVGAVDPAKLMPMSRVALIEDLSGPSSVASR
jgi:lipoprotein NlpD